MGSGEDATSYPVPSERCLLPLGHPWLLKVPTETDVPPFPGVPRDLVIKEHKTVVCPFIYL